MSAPSLGNKEQDRAPLPVELIRRFLENQTKELDLKKQDDENKKQFAKYNYELAKLSMQVQAENLKDERKHHEILWKGYMWFSVFAITTFALFSAWAFYLGKEQVILEIVRMILYGGSGAFVGSAYQKYKNSGSQDDKKKNS